MSAYNTISETITLSAIAGGITFALFATFLLIPFMIAYIEGSLK
jgi:hypothetical protein